MTENPSTDLLRILAIGDIVGRAGRRCLELLLPPLREKHRPDIVIINGENAAGGFGLTEKICRQLFQDYGADVITTGNHWQDKKEIYQFKKDYENLLLPSNMYNVQDSSSGYCQISVKGQNFVIISLTGRVFMKGENRCPFQAFDEIYEHFQSDRPYFIVDFHAEATSEKQAFAHYVTGRASLVFGTHTHCPTADERVLDQFTGYQTDLGMTGAYDSVIGMTYESALPAFLPPSPQKKKIRFEPAKKDLWLCGLLADIDTRSGAAVCVQRIRNELRPDA
ncbi:MAG: YmdB family metallophosphoesterase [Deltaproteobacteria bacterium]|nr:YmdB family metallophosphoesterase [Deltaproteobacteria bacterium]